MNLSRREFLRILGFAGAAGLFLPGMSMAQSGSSDLYDFGNFGDIRLMHMTDTHAQLMPIYYREPSMNLGLGQAFGRPPHLVTEAFLKYYGIALGSQLAHAYTAINYAEAAQRFGKVGGFAHLKTLVDKMRSGYGADKTLLLDGGDTWQGSGTAFWNRGMDMVEACNLLGVDVMTGHWEFTYLEEEVRKNLAAFKGDFVAQNIKTKEIAMFDGAQAYDENTGHTFRPYVMKTPGKHRVAVVGQAFPYTPIANPSRFIPDWTFGINSSDMQALIDDIRAKEKPDAVVLISHNGMDVDIKLAEVVSGIDVIFGGHTHDGVAQPFVVKNAKGRTLVTNAGSNGKFLGVIDLKLGGGGVKEFKYRLLPVFSNELPAHSGMQALVNKIRAPYLDKLQEPLATAGSLLYRRGNFDGPFDQIICDALLERNEAQISLSPGFRWGTTVLPSQTITMEHVLDQTCMTYPETYAHDMTGKQIKDILEDVADNLFNLDPFYQQGGDMVRTGGLNYRIDPKATMGKRIDNMRLQNGQPIDANKKYRVAGWATVGSKSPGEPVWDTVAAYLKDKKVVEINKLHTPELKNIGSNPGIDVA
ncbi:MAG TPA: thiosulfohydrolase SoxB [Chlorobaculum parvum]|uniref:Thiosulfohydrolase SoxB n=1 Tax=Chlorobaculum parvum TaxID=274539 RepID=A0A7C5DE47_9CHLB|nr:thiosulfohydrolase SoxB [Chlorobaculum parvum]